MPPGPNPFHLMVATTVEQQQQPAIVGNANQSIGIPTRVQTLPTLLQLSALATRRSGNERTDEEATGKRNNSGQESNVRIRSNRSNLHRVPKLPAEVAVEAYEAEIRGMLPKVVRRSVGHCASRYPKSAQVHWSLHAYLQYLATEGKGVTQ